MRSKAQTLLLLSVATGLTAGLGGQLGTAMGLAWPGVAFLAGLGAVVGVEVAGKTLLR